MAKSEKIKTSVSLSNDSIALLTLLAEKNSRTMSATIEVLIKEAAAKEKIKLPK